MTTDPIPKTITELCGAPDDAFAKHLKENSPPDCSALHPEPQFNEADHQRIAQLESQLAKTEHLRSGADAGRRQLRHEVDQLTQEVARLTAEVERKNAALKWASAEAKGRLPDWFHESINPDVKGWKTPAEIAAMEAELVVLRRFAMDFAIDLARKAEKET